MHDAQSVTGDVGSYITDDLYWTNADFYSSAGVTASCNFVMLSASDYNTITTAPITTNPVTTTSQPDWALSTADAVTLFTAIALLWATAFVFRNLFTGWRSGSSSSHDED
jgi:hypothetical protein